MSKTLLIDGDILAFRAVAANTLEVEWEPDLWTFDVDYASAKAALINQVETLKEDTGCPEIILCLTGPENFRRTLLPSYKGQRNRKPPGYREFQAWAQENFRAYLRPGLEGDDILGILMTHPSIVPGERILWSGDKDLKMIPGKHWRTDSQTIKNGSIVEYLPDDCQIAHVTQTLTGDTTDNYKGCPGFGPVRVASFLKKLEGAPWVDVWAAVADAFNKAGKTYDEFLVQARCARILTHELYNFNTKEPVLWTPPVS